MRVATISTYYPPFVGGVASHVQALAQALRPLGVESHIITRQWDKTITMLTSEEADLGIVVHRIPVSEQRWQGSPYFIWQCATLVPKLGVDLLHAHELLLPATAGLIAKRLAHTPLVVSVHSSGPELGECARLQRAILGKQRVPYVRREVDGFVAVSATVEADMIALDIPADKRTLIPNGVDMARFCRVDSAERLALRRRLGLPDGLLAVYTGRLVSEKRVLPLAQQWGALRQQHPNASLVLVGGGPQLDELSSFASSGVCLVGPQDNVAPFLQAADLFVLPSAAEGFSLSTLEALACGLPVVATRVGAIPDLMVDGKSGIIVPPEDMPAFVAAVKGLLGRPDALPSMGEAAREHVLQHYSTAAMALRLVEFYNRVLH